MSNNYYSDWPEYDIRPLKTDIDKFIRDLGDIQSLTAKYLLIRISSLEHSDITKVLQNNKIKDKLKYGILKESNGDFWRGFRDALNYLSVDEFLSLYDVKTIKDFFKSYQGREYIFYAAMAEKDLNKLIELILNDDEFFDHFFKLSDYFYSVFYNLNYDLFKKVILKMDSMNFPYKNNFVSTIRPEYQKRILDEDISKKAILYMLPCFKTEVVKDFFKNNYKVSYVYDKVNLIRYALEGISFSDDILKKKDFFEKLKSSSFIEFRSIINELEKNNNVDIIERKVDNYYMDIINSYDAGTGIFKEYSKYIDNPNIYFEKSSYILSEDAAYAISSHRSYDYDTNSRSIVNKNELMNELRKITSHKLSEVIVDSLFKDNIYNVWLNLKEMLRYNSKLTDNKVINDERCNFYKLILNIDNVSSNEKIALYKRLKDKKMNILFYDDLRKLKDISYTIINDSLYDVNKDISNLNKELSQSYGVDVFDLRDKEYTMLIRGKPSHRDITGRRRNCYSVISSDNSNKYGKHDFLLYYGYNSFDIDRVAHALEQDSFSSDTKNNAPSNYVNRLMMPEEIVRNSTWYSEFDIVNPKIDNMKYETKKPDFIVAYDTITDKDINEAKRLGIPIVFIKEKNLDMDLMTNVPFDSNKDIYVENTYQERQVGRR